jgi:hypothetical protein
VHALLASSVPAPALHIGTPATLAVTVARLPLCEAIAGVDLSAVLALALDDEE